MNPTDELFHISNLLSLAADQLENVINVDHQPETLKAWSAVLISKNTLDDILDREVPDTL